MSLDEIANQNILNGLIEGNVDDPFTLIILGGISAIILMAVLLKLAFISMKRADRRTQDQFDPQ